MREILFRGKRKDNGEWVFGYLIRGNRTYIVTLEAINYMVVSLNYMASVEMVEVIPEAVGQFTGLTANGTKIFEGDIVEITDDEGRTDFSDGGIGTVGFFDGLWYVNGQVHNALYDLDKCYYIEVIGNIHDNPELMESEVTNER